MMLAVCCSLAAGVATYVRMGLVSDAASLGLPVELQRVRGSGGMQADLTQYPDGAVRVTLSGLQGAERETVKWSEVLAGLAADEPALRNLLSEAMRRLPFEAFIWECAPTSRHTARHLAFEFVAMEAPHLLKRRADGRKFAELEAARGEPVVRAFPSLGGASKLIAPAQAGDDPQVYAHAASFFRRAPPEQVDALWLAVGDELDHFISQSGPSSNVWLSVGGAGPPWVHARVDGEPKYYHYTPYLDQR